MGSPAVPDFAARILAAGGAALAAAGIALAAYAAHMAEAAGQGRLHTAALFAFGHGVALAALAPHAGRGPRRLALAGLLLGVLLFAGGLAAAHFFAAPTRAVPFGGGLMMLAWLLYAADALRR